MRDYWDEAPEERISPSANPVLAAFNREAAKDISQSVLEGVFGKKKSDVGDMMVDKSRCQNYVHRYQAIVRQYPRLIVCVY